MYVSSNAHILVAYHLSNILVDCNVMLGTFNPCLENEIETSFIIFHIYPIHVGNGSNKSEHLVESIMYMLLGKDIDMWVNVPICLL